MTTEVLKNKLLPSVISHDLSYVLFCLNLFLIVIPSKEKLEILIINMNIPLIFNKAKIKLNANLTNMQNHQNYTTCIS